jgi:hypothetical protein
MFHRDGSMRTHVLCTDNSILAGPNNCKVDQIINEMKQVKLDITVEGGLEDFLVDINIDPQKDGTVNLTQANLTDQTLKDLRVNDNNVTAKEIPSVVVQNVEMPRRLQAI